MDPDSPTILAAIPPRSAAPPPRLTTCRGCTPSERVARSTAASSAIVIAVAATIVAVIAVTMATMPSALSLSASPRHRELLRLRKHQLLLDSSGHACSSSVTDPRVLLPGGRTKDGPAPYTFQQAGQTSMGFNATGSGTTAAPAAFPVTTLAGIAPATPPPVREHRVCHRTTTVSTDYSPSLRPGSKTATLQRLSNGILPNRFNGEVGPSDEGATLLTKQELEEGGGCNGGAVALSGMDKL